VVTEQDIQELVARIAAEFRPERIILFGSRAYGTPQAESDVDLLVVMPFEGSAFRKALEILNRLDPPFSVDLLIRSADEVEWRYQGLDPLIREALDKGRVVYEAAA
jgi:predicted nucleotidyltransferase